MSSIFASFDYQMKGEEWMDNSEWPLRWDDTVQNVLLSMAYYNHHESIQFPWRFNTSLADSLTKAAHGNDDDGFGPMAVSGSTKLNIAIVSVCQYIEKETFLAELSK
jgi:hypothetical protein